MKVWPVLQEGFDLGHQRLRLVFVDLLWKLLWLVLTGVVIAFSGLWFVWTLRSALQGPDLTNANPIIFAMVLRALAAAMAPRALWMLGVILAAAFALRIMLEAWFRGGRPHFWIFAGSRLARSSILAAAALLLGLLVLSDKTAGIVFLRWKTKKENGAKPQILDFFKLLQERLRCKAKLTRH